MKDPDYYQDVRPVKSTEGKTWQQRMEEKLSHPLCGVVPFAYRAVKRNTRIVVRP